MREFFLKILFRLSLLCAIVFLIFLVRVKKSYYFEIPQGTDHFKITWFWEKLQHKSIDSKSILFFGSSICQNAINDSLLNSIDSSGFHYLNCGVNHPCNALTYELISEMLQNSDELPAKVFLCLKANSINTGIHSMYGLIADKQHILNSITELNGRGPESIIKKTSWNINALTQNFKFSNSVDSSIYSGFGFVDNKRIFKRGDTDFITRDSVDIMKLMDVMAVEIKNGKIGSAISYNLQLRQILFENVNFQDSMFRKCLRLLELHSIPTDIILYPEYNVYKAEKEEVVLEYYGLRYGIDNSKHRIIWVSSSELLSMDSWSDLNHLSVKGSIAFSSELFRSWIKNDDLLIKQDKN